MTLKYESEVLFDLMKRDGDVAPSDVLPYESGLKEKYLNQVVGAYPKLQDYRPEWLYYNLYSHIPSEFPIESVANVTSASFYNVVPYGYKSATLKGQTLVNLAIEKDTVFTGANQWNHLRLNRSLLDSSKKYLVSFDSSQDYKGYVHLRDIINNTYITSGTLTPFKRGNNKVLITGFSQTELDTFADIRLTFYLNDNSVVFPTISNVILLEYVEGMENWDIPYFEGMQSVQMPVLTTTGKNLFDKSKLIRNDGMWIDENGNEIQEPVLGYIKNLYYVGTGTFKISGTIGDNIRLFFYDKHGVFKGRSPLFTNTLTFSCDEETYLRIGYRIASLNADNIQIEQGTQATTYEPYQSNILTVNEDVTLRGIGDVRDTLDCLTGEVTERVGEIVLDGSDDEIWTYNSNYHVFVFEGLKYTNIYLSTHILTQVKWNGTDRFALKTSNYGITSNSDGREYLSNHPITLQYKLESESIKTVDLSSPIRPIEGTMHVNTSSQTLTPLLDMSVPVEATTQNLMSFANIEEEE